jgi:uncharacterized coiled-coil DUF342 family protein
MEISKDKELESILTEVAMKVNVIESYQDLVNEITFLKKEIEKLNQIDEIKLSINELNRKIDSLKIQPIPIPIPIKKEKKRLEPIKI